MHTVTGNAHQTVILRVNPISTVAGPADAVLRCIFRSLCMRSRDFQPSVICLSLEILTGLAYNAHLEDLLQNVMLLAGPPAGCMLPSS